MACLGMLLVGTVSSRRIRIDSGSFLPWRLSSFIVTVVWWVVYGSFQLAKADIVAPNLQAQGLYIDFWILGDASREFPGDSWVCILSLPTYLPACLLACSVRGAG